MNPYSPNPCNWAVTINRLPHFPPPSHLPYHHNTADIISFFFYNISPVAQWKNYGVALKPKAKHYVSEASSNTLCSKPPKLRLRSSGSPCLLTISQTLHLRPAVCSSQAPQSMYPAPSAAMSGPGPIYKLRSMMHTEHPVHRFNEKNPLFIHVPQKQKLPYLIPMQRKHAYSDLQTISTIPSPYHLITPTPFVETLNSKSLRTEAMAFGIPNLAEGW